MSKIVTKVAPSLLAADFACLTSEIKKAEKSGADMLHIDVMDGHFVKNITLGPLVVRAIRKITTLPLVAHLMIENPEKYVKPFAKAGSDLIVFHIETTKNPKRLIRKIRNLGKKVGVSLKPKTSADTIKALLPLVDEVLVMTVEPGFGGQKFMHNQLSKIKKLRENFRGDIAVDGGITEKTARLVASSGANVFAAGTYLFGSKNMKKLIGKMKAIKSYAN